MGKHLYHLISMALKFLVYLMITVLVLCTQISQGQDEEDAVRAAYWFPDSGMVASDIDSTLFTHLFCAFAQLNSNTNRLTMSSECSTFPQTVRKKNPSIITLLSIGGGSVASSVFNKMASQPSSRQAFIDSSFSLARSHGYDGLDLDWEHQSTASEMNNMATLLRQWRAAADAESSTDRLILTAALAVSPHIDPQTTFPTEAISTSLDWVNVMAYDFYTPSGSSLTRAPAALLDPSGGASGSTGIQDWIQAGVPPQQLVLGFPFYGYSWKLVNPNRHGMLAGAAGIDGSIGDPQDGSVTYNEIKGFINGRGGKVVYNSTYITNYCYSGTTWIGYDDAQTISAKVSYAKKNGLFGYFAWHVAQDYNWTLSKRALQAWRA